MQPYSERLDRKVRYADLADFSEKSEDLQNGDAITGEHLHLLVPAGVHEVRTAPGIIILYLMSGSELSNRPKRKTYEGEEVASLVVSSAVHVAGELHAVLRDIRSRVSNRNLSVTTVANVLAHITSGGLDIFGCQGAVDHIVDDLVAREEGKGVVVLGKSVDCGENALEVLVIVGLVGVVTVERVQGGVGVNNDINSGIGQEVHAIVVLLGVVHHVDTDGVDSQLLELGNVALAHVEIGQGIRHAGRSSRLVVDSSDIEALLALPEGYQQINQHLRLLKGHIFQSQNHSPFPETVTAGRSALLCGCSRSVGVGVAALRLAMDANTDIKLIDFILVPPILSRVCDV